MLNGDAEPYYVGFPLSLGNTQMKKWWGSHAHMNTFDDGNPQWFRWVGQPYVFCIYLVSVSISEFRHVFAKFTCDSWILIVHWVHVLNSAVWQTKPCSNHAFPRQNSPLLATLQMYSNLHSYVKTSSNEPKYWHVIMAYHGHMKFEPRSFLKTFSTTFTAWRVAFDHFSCCYLAAKYALRSPELKSTNLQIYKYTRLSEEFVVVI